MFVCLDQLKNDLFFVMKCNSITLYLSCANIKKKSLWILFVQPANPSQPDVSQTPFGLGGMGGLPGISGLGMGSANFMEMQQRMQREVG